MRRNVVPSGFGVAVAAYLAAYSDEVKDKVSEAVVQVADEAVVELRAISPKRTGVYASSWRVKKQVGYGRTTAWVHAGPLYPRVHLLENGHAKRGGGCTMAFPHVGPAHAHAKVKLEQLVAEAIEGAR